MKKLLSPNPIAVNSGIAFIRIVTGIFLIYHGWEVFNSATMQEYVKSEMFKTSNYPLLMPYLGKSSEFIAGALLVLGLFTRVACIIIICTFIYITFFIGSGKFWYDDQHPFMFVLMGLTLFFTGPGSLSLDRKLFK